MSLKDLELINVRFPADHHVTGGQPDADQLRAAVTQGVRTVIDLRPATEDHGYDEPGLLASLGAGYQCIPVAGPGGLTREAVEALDAALAAAGDAPTMIHCASGNRVGALMALRAAWLQNASLEQALEVGRAYGLVAMEPAVRALIEG